ncbi:MAG: hypothetical protein ACYTG5_13560 [Planctomycetota bacterium]|jgi:hypothetical protein
MQSSPTDQLLGRLASIYDRSYQAIAGAELGQLDKLMEEAESVLAELRDRQPGSEAAILRVRESHGRLGGAMAEAMDCARDELSKVRRGRQDLKRFQRRSGGSGQRLRSEV